MKSYSESLYARLLTGGVLGLLSAAGNADAGHNVPAGVAPGQHIHLLDQIVVSPAWMAGMGVVAIALAVLALKRRRMRIKSD